MTLPAGLASHSLAMDDSPHVRGAIAMAQRLQRSEALRQLAEADADHLNDQAAIDRHAALAICGGYRLKDDRTGTFS